MKTSFHYLASALKVNTEKRSEVRLATDKVNSSMNELMRIATACFCGLILLGLPSRLVSAEGEAELRFNWQAGKRYTMSLSTSNETVMEYITEKVPSTPEKTMLDETSEFTISILNAAPKENCELVLECLLTKFKEVRFKDGSQTRTFSFDSTTDPKTNVGFPTAAENHAYLETKIKYLLDSECHVLRMDGTKELVSKMIARDPSSKKLLSSPLMAEARFGTNALEELLQNMMVVGLPRRKLKLSDQWTYRTENKRRRIAIESKFTFAGLENHFGRDCAHLVIEGQIRSSSDQGMLPPGMAIPNIQGQFKGNLWLDTKLKMLVERTSVEETVTMWDMPLLHGDETVPIKIKQKKTSACRLIKVEDN